jgi:hypothetical protein
MAGVWFLVGVGIFVFAYTFFFCSAYAHGWLFNLKNIVNYDTELSRVLGGIL